MELSILLIACAEIALLLVIKRYYFCYMSTSNKTSKGKRGGIIIEIPNNKYTNPEKAALS